MSAVNRGADAVVVTKVIPWQKSCDKNFAMERRKVWETRMALLEDAQVDRAVVELYEERALVYHDLLVAQNDASQGVVVAIARRRIVSEPTSAEFISANGLKGASTIRAALKDLESKDIVYKTDGGWIVYDRLFAEYLRSLDT